MRQSFLVVGLALFALCIGTFPLHAQVGTVAVPPAVSRLLIPVLDAYEKARTDASPRREEKGGTLWNAAALAGRLMENKTPAGDEALVVLLYYYIGEATGEDNHLEIAMRGRKMSPYLQKYQTRSPRISGKDYKELLLERETTQIWLRELFAIVNTGDTVTVP